MGWRELREWIRVTKDHARGGEPDPDRWTDGSVSQIEEMRRKRDERLNRTT